MVRVPEADVAPPQTGGGTRDGAAAAVSSTGDRGVRVVASLRLRMVAARRRRAERGGPTSAGTIRLRALHVTRRLSHVNHHTSHLSVPNLPA